MVADRGQHEDYLKKYGQIVAKTWADPAFKQRLIADPKVVLQEHGIAVPAGVEVRTIEQSDKLAYFPIPAPPAGSLSDEQLEQVAGGATASTAGTMGSGCCLCGTASSAGTAGSAGSV